MTALDFVVQRIRERGPITVAEFMSIALYHTEHGYYTRAARRTGRNGDFFTSVDVGSIFGSLLARQFAEMWRVLRDTGGESRLDLVEAAASNGQLARDVLDWAAANDRELYRAIDLHVVDASPKARAAHDEMFAPHRDRVAASSGRLPDIVHGVIYANELLDALPVHRVLMTEHGLRELYVDLAGDGRLIERAGSPSTEALARYLASAGVTLEAGMRAEINLAAIAWLTRACLALHRGFLVLIDYGHDARELYSPTHAAGTLTSFFRHLGDAPPSSERDTSSATPAWLVDPGSRDITSHVDLTTIRRTAEELGLTTLGFTDQTYFLLALGLSDILENTGASIADTRRRLALKTLVLPGGLGSTHKVMVFAKGVGAPRLLGLSGMRRLT